MIEPTTSADRIFNTLRDRILFGELKPGTRLVQRQIADEFGTSNIPVIESIRRLERDGFIVSHPKWGAQVNEWTGDDIEANFLMREGLETATCRLFAQRATEVEKLTLEDYNESYNNSARAHELRAAVEDDIRLHMHIVKCTRSDNLVHLAERSCLITATIRNNFITTESEIETHLLSLVGVHDEMVAALNSGDSGQAAKAGGAHVREAMTKLFRYIDKTSKV